MTPQQRTNSKMKAIETIYNGIRFRSRTEARWAVFMDALGVVWEYEREGFDLGDGVLYLPDFWLPQLNCWIEIKGVRAVPEDELKKVRRLAKQSGKDVYLFCGSPLAPDEDNPNLWYGAESAADWFPSEGGQDGHHLWCECPRCRRVGIEFDGRAGRIGCGCYPGDKVYNFRSPRLMVAYSKARQARLDGRSQREASTRRLCHGW